MFRGCQLASIARLAVHRGIRMMLVGLLGFFSVVLGTDVPEVHPDVLGFGRLRHINVTIAKACSRPGEFSLIVELDEDSRLFEAWLFPSPVEAWETISYNATSIVPVPDLDISKGKKADLKIAKIKYTGKLFAGTDIVAPMEFFTPNKTEFVPNSTSYFKLLLVCPVYHEIFFQSTSGTENLAPTVKITNAAKTQAPVLLSSFALALLLHAFQ